MENIYSIEIGKDCSKFQNFTVTPQGAIKNIEPFCDGILINYIFGLDESGNTVLRPILSTICKNEEHSDLLTQAARKLFIHLEIIHYRSYNAANSPPKQSST